MARRGKVVHFVAQGMQDIAAAKPMAKNSLFRIYSMTKAVISVGAMILVEEGKLDLDIPAVTYIPALGEMNVDGKPQERPMTLRDLLRHTAGFPNNVTTDRALRKAGSPALADSTLEESMNRLDVVPLRYQPGNAWYYSFATDVVARILEAGSGMTVDTFLDQRVFPTPRYGRYRFLLSAGKAEPPGACLRSRTAADSGSPARYKWPFYFRESTPLSLGRRWAGVDRG